MSRPRPRPQNSVLRLRPHQDLTAVRQNFVTKVSKYLHWYQNMDSFHAQNAPEAQFSAGTLTGTQLESL